MKAAAHLALFAPLALLCGSFAACSDDDTTTTATTATPTNTETGSTTSSGGGNGAGGAQGGGGAAGGGAGAGGSAPVLAFPSAVGWGKDASGGRGGEVRKVTNLLDSGEGSLRQAWEAPGNATIIFEVAGTITVSSAIRPTGNKRIAGETAFRNGGQGITIRRAGSYGDSAVSGEMGNTIVRFVRFRPGPALVPECCGDAVTILEGTDIVFDHCSMSWSTDEILNTWGPVKRVTMQNCIFSEPLSSSSHEEGEHSKAWLSGGSDTDPAQSTSHVTLYNSLFAHSRDRNPAIGGVAPEAEIVNTLIYNWGSFGTLIARFGTKEVNIINHYAITGANTSTARYPIAARANARIFVRGVYNHQRTTSDWSGVGCESGCSADYMVDPAPTEWQASVPFAYPLADEALLTAEQIQALVTANAGANLDRDEVDRRLLDEIDSGTGQVIDDPADVGGWPTLAGMTSVPLESDGDGIPDDYEQAQGLRPDDAADGAADSGNGYTNLERYLLSLTGGR